MRLLYAILVGIICVTIILLAAAFFYIDTHKRQTFYYDIKRNDTVTSTAKLHKFTTEDMIIFDSSVNTPFHSSCRTHKRKLALDKRDHRIFEYNKKELGERTIMDIYLKRMDGSVSFTAVGHSNFAYLDRFPVNKDFIIFEEDAIASYANAITRYDFKKKGLQKFDAVTHCFTLLPPLRQSVSLTLVGKKTVRIGEKKQEALQFVLRLSDRDNAYIWINEWTHAILKIENPRIGFEAVKKSHEPEIPVSSVYALESSGYNTKDITFKNADDISLAGTLAIPDKEGPHPSILLVWGQGPLDREGLGMFTNLRDYFASRGYAVLSFDKRGIGASEGKFSRFSGNDTLEDLRAALNFLLEQEELDKNNVIILGHSEGGFYASKLASEDSRVSMCVVLASMVVSNIYDINPETIDYFNKSFLPEWDEDYLADITRLSNQTTRITQDGKDWTLFQGKRIYLKKNRMDSENKPLDIMRKIKVPTLILQGKKDNIASSEHAKLLELALKEGGNEKHKLIYFGNLDHFFGDIVQDGTYRTYLTTDEKAMESIALWLGNNLIATKETTLEELDKKLYR